MKAQEHEINQEPQSIVLYPLPDDWKWLTVNDAGADQKNAIVDGPFGSNLKVSDYVEDGSVPVLTTKNLEGHYEQVRYISQAKFDELKRSAVYPGDILIAKIGSCGKTGIYPDNRPPAMIPANLLKITLNENFELKYVYHYFNSKFFQSALRTITKATAQPAFGVTNFRKLPLPFVERSQQRFIVAEIEKQFSRLDEAVANLKRVKANLKRYRAAVLKAAVEGRLVETEAELARREGRSYETGQQLLQRILETRRRQWQGKGKYKEPTAPDTTDLPELPEGWVWVTPDQLALSDDNAICAGPFGTIFKAKDFRDFGVPIIFLRHVLPGRYSTRKPGFMDGKKWQELFQPYSVYGGELLITKLGEPPGACAIYPFGIGPAMVTPDVIKMSANEKVIVPSYLMFYFNSEAARNFSSGVAFGTTRTRLTIPIFRVMPVALPPLEEQHRIVAEVDRRFSILREADAKVAANLHRAERLRQSILSRAFSGELVNNYPTSSMRTAAASDAA